MYYSLLILHSTTRWLVLISLVATVLRAYYGWRKGLVFTPFDHTLRLTTATIAHIQLILGLCLYSTSPITQYFLANFKEAIHDRPIRFFGMEHASVMILAIVLITLGSIKTKRQTDDTARFKTMTIWFAVALFAILTSIPWAFSPLVSRPHFRFW